MSGFATAIDPKGGLLGKGIFVQNTVFWRIHRSTCVGNTQAKHLQIYFQTGVTYI